MTRRRQAKTGGRWSWGVDVFDSEEEVASAILEYAMTELGRVGDVVRGPGTRRYIKITIELEPRRGR